VRFHECFNCRQAQCVFGVSEEWFEYEIGDSPGFSYLVPCAECPECRERYFGVTSSLAQSLAMFEYEQDHGVERDEFVHDADREMWEYVRRYRYE
jgi:hypothetical protein